MNIKKWKDAEYFIVCDRWGKERERFDSLPDLAKHSRFADEDFYKIRWEMLWNGKVSDDHYLLG